MASTDPDELYTLRNLFWLGSFQQAINEGGRLNRLSDELKIERDEFVYRSYVRSRRPAVLRCLHAIDARRLQERRSWVVSF